MFLMRRCLFAATLLQLVAHASIVAEDPGTRRTCDSPELYEEHPVLCHMLDRLAEDEEALARDIFQWTGKHGLLVGENLPLASTTASTSFSSSKNLPVVFAHGMGDSCFNSGMQRIGAHTSELLGGVYVTCVPTGDTQSEDTTNGYFLNMDASVDVFASKIAQDPKLAKGFHAIGFSQGNNVIRGYIARYNDPPVDTFLSVNGVNAGVGAVPYCRPKETNEDSLQGGMCDLLMEQASRRAYTTWTQQHSFQANYWRDPRPVEQEKYEEFSQLARWNNEGQFNQTYKDNYAKTNKFVWILATEDGMVWPKEGEHWGAPDPKDPFHKILPMNETEWYQQDLFGLKTAQEAGKNYFDSFEGDHLQFQMDDFDRWVRTYLAVKNDDKGENNVGASLA
jgi:palmitoyl-protein thioesterase